MRKSNYSSGIGILMKRLRRITVGRFWNENMKISKRKMREQ